MADLDPEHHQVVFRVAVVGSAGQRLLDLLPLEQGLFELPAVAGYSPRFRFQLFPDEPWAGDASSGAELEALVPTLDALVLCDDYAVGRHYSSSAVERLAKTLGPIKLRVPAAVFGGPALAEEWQSLSNTPVVALVDPRSDDGLSIVKALAKPLLRRGVRSTPPPPPAD